MRLECVRVYPFDKILEKVLTYTEHKDRGSNDFRKELSSLGQETGRVLKMGVSVLLSSGMDLKCHSSAIVFVKRQLMN
jgi:hypothetical protein